MRQSPLQCQPLAIGGAGVARAGPLRVAAGRSDQRNRYKRYSQNLHRKRYNRNLTHRFPSRRSLTPRGLITGKTGKDCPPYLAYE